MTKIAQKTTKKPQSHTTQLRPSNSKKRIAQIRRSADLCPDSLCCMGINPLELVQSDAAWLLSAQLPRGHILTLDPYQHPAL